MISIAKHIDEERDVLYLRGEEKAQTKFVTNLLKESDFSLDKIAKIASVSLDFVKNIQQNLNNKK